MDRTNAVLRLHPENPRYFLFRGETLAPVTATEHYGAVVNPDLDGPAYLDMLRAHDFRLTRIFCLLREQEAEFGGHLGLRNTLSPARDRYVCPWKRSAAPGCLDGGAKFDLTRWNGEYFERLKAFCAEASRRGIVVEVTLFSQYYSDAPTGPWRISPLHPGNNVQGLGVPEYWQFTGGGDPRTAGLQEELTRRVATSLAGMDNVYFEVCNEPNPSPGQPSLGLAAIGAWHNRIIAAFLEAEATLPERHLIAVCDPTEHVDLTSVSVLNFHYREWAFPGLEKWRSSGKALCFDETLTGVVSWNAPLDFAARRREAWEYMLSGGSGYDYLDLTVTTGDPDGCGAVEFPDGQHYDGETMREYLRHLNGFLRSLDLPHMRPGGPPLLNAPRTAGVRMMGSEDGSCALYLQGDGVGRLTMVVPAGEYEADWYDPRTGAWGARERLSSRGEATQLRVPRYQDDIALRVTRVRQGAPV